MKKIIRRLAVFIFALPIIGLAIANRHWVIFSFDPLSQSAPFFSLKVPLYALLLSGVFLGIIIGGIAAWLNQSKWRKATRAAQVDADDWRAQANRLKASADQNSPALNAPPPADE